MKILTLYLETTIPNLLADQEDKQRHSATKKLFQEIKTGKYQASISELVLQEIRKTADATKKKTLLEAVKKFRVLKVSPVAKELAQRYLAEKVLSESARLDSLHLAIATVGEVDFVVSWNLKHIVKVKTKLGVNSINLQLGFKTIDIVTPWEVIENGL